MQQKITFSNQTSSYFNTKTNFTPNIQKPSAAINFGQPVSTTEIDYKNTPDQTFNRIQNSLNFNSTTSIANDLSGINKYSQNSKANFQLGNINESVNKIQQQLYKKQSSNQHTLPYQAFPKALKQTKVYKENKIQVIPFKIDTEQFQTVKQNQFVGCFHCFSSAKYEALKKN